MALQRCIAACWCRAGGFLTSQRYRSGRARGLCLSSDASSGRGLDVLYDRIRAGGPLTVAEYMRECLLHPITGYYMQRDVFGAKGDYITSPEISQVFGELLAVWVLADWMNTSKPARCQLVELGPGRGTLAKDMLRVFGQFKSIQSTLSLHLVEASPALSMIQHQTLQGGDVLEATTADVVSSCVPYKSCTLDSGVQVAWYQHLKDVPKDCSYYIAHEFFDALPVHQFQWTSSGWREVLVDIDPQDDKSSQKLLRFVLAPGPTPASEGYAALLPPSAEGGQGEVCPEGLVIVKELAARVRAHRGAALVADYGDVAIRRHTLRGFKQHRLHDVLVDPGTADLTADVDFGAFKRAVSSEGAGCFGPITQNEFLHKMGIRQRIDVLLQGATPTQVKDLLSSYEVLTSPDKMGHRFKFLTITPSHQHTPTPFS